MTFNPLERRIIELSFQNKLSHISSCLNCVNLINDIYNIRQKDDPFVLGNSHAALALYVVLEAKGLCDAKKMIERHGVHAGRDMEHGIWVSGGSLGQAETIALGMAMADPKRTVWLVTSDGACMEGAVYETFRLASKYCPNLKIWIVYNGLGAYGKISLLDLPRLIANATIYPVEISRYPKFLQGLSGHYLVLNEQQYAEIMQ